MLRQLVSTACFCLLVSSARAQEAAGVPLAQRVASLDSSLFAAYNTCNLGSLGAHFAARVDVYSANGVVTTTRVQAVDYARRNICRKELRELVPGTHQVFPVGVFGALATGEQRFCDLASGRCESIAKYLIVWRNGPYGWQATSVINYANRAVP